MAEGQSIQSQQIVSMKEAGLPTATICSTLGVTPKQVNAAWWGHRRIMKRDFNIDIPTKVSPKSNTTVQAAIKEHQASGLIPTPPVNRKPPRIVPMPAPVVTHHEEDDLSTAITLLKEVADQLNLQVEITFK